MFDVRRESGILNDYEQYEIKRKVGLRAPRRIKPFPAEEGVFRKVKIEGKRKEVHEEGRYGTAKGRFSKDL